MMLFFEILNQNDETNEGQVDHIYNDYIEMMKINNNENSYTVF